MQNNKGLLSPSPIPLPSFALGPQILKRSARSCLGVVHSLSNYSDLIWVIEHRVRRVQCPRGDNGSQKARMSYQLVQKQSQALQMKTLEREEMIFPQASGTFQQFRNTTALAPPNSSSQHRL